MTEPQASDIVIIGILFLLCPNFMTQPQANDIVITGILVSCWLRSKRLPRSKRLYNV